jgi:hypothetical protein
LLRFHVRFAPKATELLRCRKLTRCAKSVITRRSKLAPVAAAFEVVA